VAQLSAAGHAATDRGTRLQVTLGLDMDDRSAEVSIVVTSHGTLDRGRRRLWKTASAIVGKLEPHCR